MAFEPQFNDDDHTLLYKAALEVQSYSGVQPPYFNDDKHTLIFKLARGIAGISGGGSGSAAQVVTAPSNDSDFSMFPGGAAPSSGVYFAQRDNATIWSFAAGQTTWKIIATDVP